VSRADRVAVPALVVGGILMTLGGVRLPPHALEVTGNAGQTARSWATGLDIVMAYQVSWILMFADYSRYTASASKATVAVFLGLALTSLWFMPIGWIGARAAGSHDPGAMLAALGLGASGAALMALATVTTNFVNIYLSSLALKSLRPRLGDQTAVWTTGLVGAALGLASATWLDRYAGFMLVLGSLLVPVGGILVAHYFLLRVPVQVEALYETGERPRARRFSRPALLAWAAGTSVYWAASDIGGTLPALVGAVVVYATGLWLAARRSHATTTR
jgi:purine-cytosine permease-like protein